MSSHNELSTLLSALCELSRYISQEFYNTLTQDWP